MKNHFQLTGYFLILFLLVFATCKSINNPSDYFEYLVHLSECDKTQQSQISNYFNTTKIDDDKGIIKINSEGLKKQIQVFISTGILNDDIQSFSFYRPLSHPRLTYWEYIINQLPDFVDYGYHYESYAPDTDEKGKLFAFLAYRINRNPQSIRTLFDFSKSTIYATIDKETYEKKQLGNYTRALIKTYEHWIQFDHYESDMERIFQEIKKQDEDATLFCRTPFHYEILRPYMNTEVTDEFIGSHTYETNGEYSDALWFHTFWIRRQHEGNAAVVYAILKEIEEKYQS